MVFMVNLLNSFLNFGPNAGTYGSFTVTSFLTVSMFSVYFTQVMLFVCSFVTFSNTLILCTFLKKTFIKSFISCSKYFPEQMFSARDKNPLILP